MFYSLADVQISRIWYDKDQNRNLLDAKSPYSCPFPLEESSASQNVFPPPVSFGPRDFGVLGSTRCGISLVSGAFPFLSAASFPEERLD